MTWSRKLIDNGNETRLGLGDSRHARRLTEIKRCGHFNDTSIRVYEPVANFHVDHNVFLDAGVKIGGKLLVDLVTHVDH